MLALAALTNVALALHIDPQLPQTLVRRGVVLAWCERGWRTFAK